MNTNFKKLNLVNKKIADAWREKFSDEEFEKRKDIHNDDTSLNFVFGDKGQYAIGIEDIHTTFPFAFQFHDESSFDSDASELFIVMSEVVQNTMKFVPEFSEIVYKYIDDEVEDADIAEDVENGKIVIIHRRYIDESEIFIRNIKEGEKISITELRRLHNEAMIRRNAHIAEINGYFTLTTSLRNFIEMTIESVVLDFSVHGWDDLASDLCQEEYEEKFGLSD